MVDVGSHVGPIDVNVEIEGRRGRRCGAVQCNARLRFFVEFVRFDVFTVRVLQLVSVSRLPEEDSHVGREGKE